MFTESPTWGVTRNPWDTERTPGGSSGGSGAAVAAGLAAAATASDGAGSIRYPAAYCSLFGLKPQRGRVALDPDFEHWHGMSVNGCLTRTVLDTALFLDVDGGGGQRPTSRRRPGARSPRPRRAPPASCESRSRSSPPGRWRPRCSTLAAARAVEETAELWPRWATR